MEKFEKLDNDQKELVKYWMMKHFEGEPISIPKFIEKHLTPEPVIEVGKWYKKVDSKISFLLFISDFKIDDNGKFLSVTGYGFDYLGGWCDNPFLNATNVSELKEATHEEVETRLIEEAKRLGLIKGATANGSIFGGMWYTKGVLYGGYEYREDINSLSLGFDIFKNGQWAEIIDENKELKEEVKKLSDQLIIVKQKLGINHEL